MGREAHDDERDQWFAEHGMLTHRVTASAIAQDKGAVIEGICAVARDRLGEFEQGQREYLARLSSPEGEVARRIAP
jgi:very-short-patch-repair endonuclease